LRFRDDYLKPGGRIATELERKKSNRREVGELAKMWPARGVSFAKEGLSRQEREPDSL
jgi:hypothetical protein